MKTIKELMGLEEADKMKGEDPCWAGYEMVGMKMKNGKKVPNCVPKAKPKNEEVETVEEASDTKRPPNFTMHPIDRQDYKILRKPKKTPQKDSKEWGRDGGEKKIKEETENVTEMENRSKENDDHERREYGPEGTKQRNKKTQELLRKVSPAMRKKLRLPEPKEGVSEETEQIDELNKDTVYSYNKKADADIEKKHKSLGQLMRKGDAAGANKAAHQLNKRVAGMERAEKRLNSEEVELGEEEVKKAKMTPQERAYKRKLGLKAVVQEAVKKMKDKKGDPSQSKNVKKGEPLSGKQEPVKLNPELQEK